MFGKQRSGGPARRFRCVEPEPQAHHPDEEAHRGGPDRRRHAEHVVHAGAQGQHQQGGPDQRRDRVEPAAQHTGHLPDEHIAHRDLVDLLVQAAGSGRHRFVEWPPEKKAIDIGSFYADSTLFKARTGWAPRVGLAEGLRRTLDYYRPRMAHYV